MIIIIKEDKDDDDDDLNLIFLVLDYGLMEFCPRKLDRLLFDEMSCINLVELTR